MPLRGSLLTALIALALTATCAVNGRADSFLAAQSEGQAAESELPVIPSEDAIARYQGLIVDEIRWPNIPSAVDQKRWSELISQKVGQPLERELIQESIHKLHETGRFADIRVEAEPALGDQVILSFFTMMQPNGPPSLFSIAFLERVMASIIYFSSLVIFSISVVKLVVFVE